MVSLRLVAIDDVRGRIDSLLSAHWSEVAKFKSSIPLSIDWDSYYEAERTGALIAIVAEESGIIIGYNVYLLRLMIHNTPAVMSSNDIIYIDPKYRHGTLAMRMIKMGEKESSLRGASVISMHVKKDHDFSSLLVHLGYEQTESVFCKVLH